MKATWSTESSVGLTIVLVISAIGYRATKGTAIGLTRKEALIGVLFLIGSGALAYLLFWY